MAGRQQQSRRSRQARRAGGQGALGPFMGLVLLGGLAAVAPQTAVIMLAGLLPTLVAWIVETEDQSHLTACVGFMNLAGIIPAIVLLVPSLGSFAGLTRTLAEPVLWAAMYGGAAIGWVLYLSMPTLAEAMMRHRLDDELERLQRAQKELLREWGPEVAGSKSQD